MPQGNDNAYLEINNFDRTQHAKGCSCEPCAAFGKVLMRMLGQMPTGQEQEGRLVAFHFKSWLKETMDGDKPT